MVGLVALVVVGSAVIAYGALADRAKNRRRAAEMLAPPKRVIPHFATTGTGPRYVSELQARRPPAPSTVPAPPTSSGGEGVEVGVGYASKDFVTDPARRQAVLHDPVVLVCGDRVDTIRELLPVLEQVLRTRTPLVLVVPEVAPEVLGTLEVNAIQQKVALLVVLADEAHRRQVVELTGATPVDRSDRQSGYVMADRLGRVARWTSGRDASHLVVGSS